MGTTREFYPYSGPGTAALRAVDAVELAHKKVEQPYKAEELKKDRESLADFLRKKQGICVIKIRAKRPQMAKQILAECQNFKAFIKKELVTHGRFDGEQGWVLYLIPSANKRS